jgi:hypothetical protein
MASSSTGQDVEFSLWTSGHGFRLYRSACRTQPLGPQDMDSNSTRQDAQFILWDFRKWIQTLQGRMQNSASGPLDIDITSTGQDICVHCMSKHEFHHYRSGSRIHSLDSWTKLAPSTDQYRLNVWISRHGIHNKNLTLKNIASVLVYLDMDFSMQVRIQGFSPPIACLNSQILKHITITMYFLA